MGKKGGGKKGKKGKKGPEDWGQRVCEKYVTVEIRNSIWQSMRFSQRLGTSTKLSHLVDLIIDKHQVAGTYGLNLFMGAEVEDNALLRPEEYALSLSDVNFPCGSMNDQVVQVVTYEYAPHKTQDAGTINPSRIYGISNLPRGLSLPPLRQIGP